MKTSELTGQILDWVVANIETKREFNYGLIGVINSQGIWLGHGEYMYSTDWSLGGPIIEREVIATWNSSEPEKGKWAAFDRRWMDLPPESAEFMMLPDPWHGATPLEAAMRCYVASKLGDEVKVSELFNDN